MENIPKITPTGSDNLSGDVYNAKVAVDQTSNMETVLIPKINTGDNIVTQKKNTVSDSPGKMRRKNKKLNKILFALFLLFLVALSIIGILSYSVYKDALKLKTQANRLKDSFAQKDLDISKTELTNLKNEIGSFDRSYSRLSFVKAVPVVSSYYKDGEHLINASLYGVDAGELLLDTVKPYADILGFKVAGQESASVVRTAQDKIDFVIKTIPDIVPKIDDLSEKVDLLTAEVENIDPDRYPEEFRGIKVRENLVRAIELLETTNDLIVEGKPLLEKSDYFLGVESPRTYMVLFQNDKELRPTGGFITAYSIARVDKGRFEPIASDDIYNLDDRYTPSIKAPEQFPKYLKGIYIALNRFRLRDMNWSPDFEVSMDTFSKEVQKTGIDKVDGIIAVDTQMLVYLLEVLGKVSVPGYGDFSTEIVPECKCPQVVYELESFADQEGAVVWSENEPGKIVFAPENYGARKKIIGPLMNSILSATLGQPDEKMPALFEAAIKSFTEKHALFYLFNDEAQSAVKAFGVAGDVKEYDGDYLYINDANLGGRKSNLYVTQEVVQGVVKKDGYIEKTLEITYKNPEKQDGWLNSVLPNWLRIYVPKGSEIISTEGLENVQDTYEEFGKTVFAGYVEVRPLGVAKAIIKYKVPVVIGKDYKLMIQKQPGKDTSLYTLNYGKISNEFLLKIDKEIRI
ncbi:MAG: hypothetical protein US95_C0052G0004 [Candidatus Woesebacteria bacterium GW2011_GWB1_38_5]|uniref:DUF4012 domain-containing protein n=3 Tax=Candidatus Woeseibacteriota TaxID=1752722 RepID=A0A0G0MIS6_9BACT|nr:MAG: hypothetical protein US67_C0010G0007 [Candidatus Woesebacteria bacterium GW2011_GWD1_38_10]KKQ73614.1 MAG: hypothetical protein US95_C0052G0004 [Candidatus Woesebacteria bacterium GW2011_GWB1_38_5]